MLKRLLKVIFILFAIWINVFTIDYVRVYEGNKPLFYFIDDYTKEICGDEGYVGFGYMFEIDREMWGKNIGEPHTCYYTGKFKVCPLFTSCSVD